MRVLVLFALFCSLGFGQFWNAKKLGGKPLCSASITTDCVPSADTSGNVAIGATLPTGAPPNLLAAGTRLTVGQPLAQLRAALRSGASTAIQVIGDSTSNDTVDWVYLTAQWMATAYPNYTVRYIPWNTGGGVYDPATVIQTGSTGERYMDFPGGSYAASFPAADIPAITGDLDVAVKTQPANWTPAAVQILAAHYGGAGARSWYLALNTDNHLIYNWSNDGTNSLTKSCTATFSSTDPVWVRVTHDVDNGAAGNDIKFYSSTDGETWAQLGTTVTTAGTTTIFNASAEDWTIGARGSSSGPLTGKIFRVRIAKTIGGLPENPFPIEAWRPLAAAVTVKGSPEIVWVNGSIAGAGLAAHTALMPQITPSRYWPGTFILNIGHNEVTSGPGKMDAFGAYIDLVKAQLKMAEVTIVTQNPTQAPATTSVQQANRRMQLLSWAPVHGYSVIDTYQAFANDSRGLNTLLNADGIHPANPTGYQLWRDVVAAVIKGAL